MSLELSDARVTTTMHLISEALMLTATVLTHTGTNSSDSMVHTSTINKAKSLMLRMPRTKKVSLLEPMLRKSKLHSSGPSDTWIR